MRIKQFRETRREVDDIGAEIDMDFGKKIPGFVYVDGLTIDKTDTTAIDGNYCLTIGHMQYFGPLAKMEWKLYQFAKSEGYFE